MINLFRGILCSQEDKIYENKARKNNVLDQSTDLFTSSLANPNAPNTIKDEEKVNLDKFRKREPIQGPLAVKENNSIKSLVLHAMILFSEQIFAFLGKTLPLPFS